MVSAEEYVHAYQNQTGTDSTDAVTFLVDFLVSYGMGEAALETLCQLIDEEGVTTDFNQHLRENGFVVDTPEAVDDEDELLDMD